MNKEVGVVDRLHLKCQCHKRQSKAGEPSPIQGDMMSIPNLGPAPEEKMPKQDIMLWGQQTKLEYKWELNKHLISVVN